MARPPKVPNLLPLEQPTIYFLTICVDRRKPVLTNPQAWQCIREQFKRLEEKKRWNIVAALAMPDHLHWLAGPVEREESVIEFVRWFKRRFNASLNPQWRWQKGCFDRFLRSDESAQQKWDYIRQNPVRAGLVESPERWPYQMGFEEKSALSSGGHPSAGSGQALCQGPSERELCSGNDMVASKKLMTAPDTGALQ
jgi:putative transposase